MRIGSLDFRLPTGLVLSLAGLCSSPLESWHPPSDSVLFSRDQEIEYSLEWYWAPLGTAIGLGGMTVTDVDGDGQDEIVLAAGGRQAGPSRQWYILEWTGDRYATIFTHPPYPSAIGALVTAQADSDAAQEIFVAISNQILVYDGSSRRLENVLVTTVANPKSMAVVDVDADHVLEAVLCNSAALSVYSLETGDLESRLPGFGGVAMDVGQIDDDDAYEIAVANGTSTGRVVDGASLDIDWQLEAGFGSHVRFANLDQEPDSELIFGAPWNDGIQAWKIPEGLFLWDEPIFLGLGALTSADFDNDQIDEVIYGGAQWGEIHVLRGQSGSELWSVSNPDWGVDSIAVGDGDGDGVPEIFWGAGHGSTGGSHLLYADAIEHEPLSTQEDLVAPFLALDHGDIDADFEPELLVGSYSSDGGFLDGRYLYLTPDRGDPEFLSDHPSGTWTNLWKAKAANLDSDPQLEVCITNGSAYTGRISCFDGLSQLEQRRFDVPEGSIFTSLEIADLDGDGETEIVGGVEDIFSGVPGPFVYAIDGFTSALRWRSPDLGAGFENLAFLRVGQADTDRELEVVVGAHGSWVTVLRGPTGETKWSSVALEVTALDLSHQDRPPRITLGTANGRIRALDAPSGQITEIAGPFAAEITGLDVVDLNQDGHDDILFGESGTLKLFDGKSRQIVWESEFVGEDVGQMDSLLVADVDRDGALEIVANTGFGVLLLEAVATDLEVFADGFETGDTSAWSSESTGEVAIDL